MKTVVAMLTLFLFILIALSFVIPARTGTIYTLMGAVFIILVVVSVLARGRGGDSHNESDGDNQQNQ